ncbi:MAG: hypothetical protein SFW09_16595 [Hyphomicrobiaceae bacterium]|nr:hypothetical protein [Hyphomicrobiaceae bacterium]
MSTPTSLPRRLRDALAKELPGEPILWTGRPSALRAFLASLPIWLFAIPWTAFSLGWEYMALGGWLSGKPPPSPTHSIMGIVFPLFGLPFVLIGIGMMLAPFAAWSRARRTVHAVSNHRFLTITVGRRLTVKSHATSSIVRTERIERRDGTGTLKVVTGIRRDSDGDRVEDTEVLIGIPEVRKVDRLIASRIENVRRAA